MKKKLVSAMLVVTMVASLTACGKKKETTTSTLHPDITAAEYDATITSDADIYKKCFTLPEYKGIEVTVDRSSLTVTDEDVTTYINENILSQLGTTESITSGTTTSGDTIILDYTGKQDGVAFSGGTATDATYTIGSGKFIEDLDKGLVGLDVGKEYDIPCTFPTNYSPSSLAGQNVIFTVKVTSIEKTTYPELTDAWVAENAESLGVTTKTADEFKAYIKEILEQDAQDSFIAEKFKLVYEVVSENVGDVNYPQEELDSLLNTLKTNIQSEFDNYGSLYGVSDLESYITSIYGFSSMDEYNEYALESAKTYLLEKMVVTVIAADNDIHVTEQEITDYGNELAEYYEYDDFQAIIDTLGNEVVAEIGYQVLYTKVQDFVCDKAVEK
ncbi:MAG: FKBP-type peptidyl-prolyl cis-trans isomerase [Eubacteriales bacterium]|nr:FKBP-type peptidyl-prolyl cis-trans isomerase [Eubacteriales bacterium]